MATQVCRTCKEEKPLDEYGFRTDSNKHRTDCKICRSKKHKQWRDSPKEEKEVLPEDKNRCKTCKELKNITEFAIRADTGLRRNQCILCRNEYVAGFKRSDKQKVKQRASVKNRRKNDPIFYLKSRLRATLGNYLRKCYTSKSTHTIDLLGCSIKATKEHL